MVLPLFPIDSQASRMTSAFSHDWRHQACLQRYHINLFILVVREVQFVFDWFNDNAVNPFVWKGHSMNICISVRYLKIITENESPHIPSQLSTGEIVLFPKTQWYLIIVKKLCGLKRLTDQSSIGNSQLFVVLIPLAAVHRWEKQHNTLLTKSRTSSYWLSNRSLSIIQICYFTTS